MENENMVRATDSTMGEYQEAFDALKKTHQSTKATCSVLYAKMLFDYLKAERAEVKRLEALRQEHEHSLDLRLTEIGKRDEQIEALQAEIEKRDRVLAFYGDDLNYDREVISHGFAGITEEKSIIEKDEGQKAREVLANRPTPEYKSKRNRVDEYIPAELAIREAMLAVEQAGAHVLLTDAVVLLGNALDKVSQFVEQDTPREVLQ